MEQNARIRRHTASSSRERVAAAVAHLACAGRLHTLLLPAAGGPKASAVYTTAAAILLGGEISPALGGERARALWARDFGKIK